MIRAPYTLRKLARVSDPLPVFDILRNLTFIDRCISVGRPWTLWKSRRRERMTPPKAPRATRIVDIRTNWLQNPSTASAPYWYPSMDVETVSRWRLAWSSRRDCSAFASPSIDPVRRQWSWTGRASLVGGRNHRRQLACRPTGACPRLIRYQSGTMMHGGGTHVATCRRHRSSPATYRSIDRSIERLTDWHIDRSIQIPWCIDNATTHGATDSKNSSSTVASALDAIDNITPNTQQCQSYPSLIISTKQCIFYHTFATEQPSATLDRWHTVFVRPLSHEAPQPVRMYPQFEAEKHVPWLDLLCLSPSNIQYDETRIWFVWL